MTEQHTKLHFLQQLKNNYARRRAHGKRSSNRGRRSLTLLLLRRGEKEAARGVDGVVGALALPATISSSVFIRRRREQGGNQGRDQGEVDLHKRAELQFA